MFDKKNHDQDDALRLRIERLGQKLEPSGELMQAAINGAPLRGNSNRYTAGYHVGKFAKAVIAYAVGIALFLGMIWLLPRLFDTQEPVGTQSDSTTTTAVTTIDRDKLTLSLSKQKQALYRSAWEALKNMVPEYCTINNLQFGTVIMEYDEAFICFYRGFLARQGDTVTEGGAYTYQTVAGYEFIYGSTLQYTVFANGKKYNLETAYNAGVLTEDEIRMIWEEHKAGNSIYYTEG